MHLLSSFFALLHQLHLTHTPVMISLQPAEQSTSQADRDDMPTNHLSISLIRFIDAFPYLAEPATGNWIISGLGDECHEVLEDRFTING
jgi:hypothetical protein